MRVKNWLGVCIAIGGLGVAGSAPAGAAAATAAPGWVGTTTSAQPSVSADGRFVVFEAYQPVEGDVRDVALRDVRRGRTTLLTHSVVGDSAGLPVISDDGSRVAWLRFTASGVRLMVRDLGTGRTTGEGAADGSSAPDLSADGRYVTFARPRAGGNANDVVVRDVDSDATTLVSVSTTGAPGNGSSSEPGISADGRYVLFTSSATDLTSDGTGANGAIYVRDLRRRTTVVVPDETGDTSQQAGYGAKLSPDGRYVSYTSTSVFRVDLRTGATVAVSPPNGELRNNGRSVISAQGRFVAWWGTYLDGPEGIGDAFTPITVRNVAAGTDEVASAGPDGALEPWTGSYLGAISPNGRYVVFYSEATNLTSDDTDGELDVFLRDLCTDKTTLVSKP
jgi:Tol biopolymer transport system component